MDDFSYTYLSSETTKNFHSLLYSEKDNTSSLEWKSFDSFCKDIDIFDIKKDLSFILLDNKLPAGLSLCAQRKNKGYISVIFIPSLLRKQGYGKIILEKCIHLFEKNNCTHLELEVFIDNSPAISLYSSRGFYIEDTLYNIRNENRSFYNKNHDITLQVATKLEHFIPLFRLIHGNTSLPWLKDFKTLKKRIEFNQSVLYYGFREERLLCYAVVSFLKSEICIYSLGSIEKDPSIISGFLSLLTNQYRSLTIYGMSQHDPLFDILSKIGFYIESQQYRMTRKLP